MPSIPKHIPMRMCIVCRQCFPQKNIRRFPSQKAGRGIYICQENACLERLQKEEKLRKRYGIDEELLAKITKTDRDKNN